MKDIKAKYLLLFYTIFNLRFFSYKGIPGTMMDPIINAVNIVPLLLFCYYLVIEKKIKKGYFSRAIGCFIAAMVVSSISAFLTYGQSFYESLSASSYLCPFFLYLILVHKSVSKEIILYIVKFFFFSSLIIFIVDIITFPNSIFAWRLEERLERQSLGIFFFGIGFTVLGTFYYFYSFLQKGRVLHFLIYCVAFLFITFLTGTRTYLFGLLGGTAFMLLLHLIQSKNSIKKSLIIFFVFFISSITITYGHTYLTKIYDITGDQLAEFTTDIRYECLDYFTGDFQKNTMPKLLGNGFPHTNSNLGHAFEDAMDEGYYTSDIGIFGVWVHWGVLGVLFWILIFTKSLKLKYIHQNTYVNSYIVFLLINSFLVYTLFDPGFIMAHICAFYLFDNKQKESKTYNKQSYEVQDIY